ncbi:hypothetical protein C8Q74DRAFT_1255765 [Fomes fomentarius]|nr:hypothetical protein C8Q74DRAFT_1255765 [Fomes fomentarius]
MLVSQLFFVRRVYLMGRMFRVIAVLATLFFLAENGIALGALLKGLSLTSFSQFVVINQIIAVTFVLAAVGDTLLAISLFVVIARNCEVSSTSTSDEKPAANAFITYVINTGMLHDILNVLSLVLAVGFPTTFWSQAVNHITTKVYAITLLTVLNTRKLSFTDGVQVVDRGEQYGRNIIARADNLATKERWNVPQVPEAPAVINISVATEMEDERNAHWFKRSESTSSSTYKSRDNMV